MNGATRAFTAGIRITVILALAAASSVVFAQGSQEPVPGAPRNVSVPEVREFSLANGLKVLVVRRAGSPLVSVQMSMAAGAAQERSSQAGLARMSAELLTKGTRKRSASEIASAVEYLGGSLTSSSSWTSAELQLSVTSDKLDEAFSIFAESLLEPSFSQAEVDLLKAQTADGLAYSLSQPGFLGSYAASAFSFGEHPAGGSLKSIEGIDRDAVIGFARRFFAPNRSTLIFVGDIDEKKARTLSARHLAKWRRGPAVPAPGTPRIGLAQRTPDDGAMVRRILVIDLPNSGQASVSFNRRVGEGRLADPMARAARRTANPEYYVASVLNSVLGGGYSSRLNQEIRIKRGLSYGAGSSFAWRSDGSNFSTRTQTKNESAAEVVSLVADELAKLRDSEIGGLELIPRKAVLTGGFGRSLETNREIAVQIGALYPLGLGAGELNSYIPKIDAVEARAVKAFAARNMAGFDVIVVGDQSVFGEELRRRFPKTPITAVKAAELDISTLR